MNTSNHVESSNPSLLFCLFDSLSTISTFLIVLLAHRDSDLSHILVGERLAVDIPLCVPISNRPVDALYSSTWQYRSRCIA